jgi:transglutaminase-like putative cysteine protease
MIAFAEQYITIKALGEFPKISRSFFATYALYQRKYHSNAYRNESFSARQGVCQDHSHVLIAMAKALGTSSLCFWLLICK